jgi:glutathione peroxidase
MRNQFHAIALMLALAFCTTASAQNGSTKKTAQKEHGMATNVMKGVLKSIHGEDVDLSKYDQSVVVVVNVASECGFTKQYAALEKLFQTHKDDGLVVLGMPCNQFGKQEPGSAQDIAKFCSLKFNVTFDLFEKTDVNGDNRNSLYAAMCSLDLQPKGAGDVKWNFEKFIIGRDGVPVARFASRVAPDDEAFLKVIKQELAK